MGHIYVCERGRPRKRYYSLAILGMANVYSVSKAISKNLIGKKKRAEVMMELIKEKCWDRNKERIRELTFEVKKLNS